MAEVRICMERPFDEIFKELRGAVCCVAVKLTLFLLPGCTCYVESLFLFYLFIVFSFQIFLIVHLDVDAKSADSWYKAK
jgi:hypothetical protein